MKEISMEDAMNTPPKDWGPPGTPGFDVDKPQRLDVEAYNNWFVDHPFGADENIDLEWAQRAVRATNALKAAYEEIDNNNRDHDSLGKDERGELVGIEDALLDLRQAYERIAELEAEVARLQEEHVDNLITILFEHSYAAKEEHWFYHSCMSDQEYEIGRLVELGVFEEHKNGHWYRKKDDPEWNKAQWEWRKRDD